MQFRNVNVYVNVIVNIANVLKKLLNLTQYFGDV